MNRALSTTTLPAADKSNHAVVTGEDGKVRRTIWGYFLPEDVDVIAREYPEIPRKIIEQIACTPDSDHVELIPAPRLLEVLVPLELIARYQRGEFSRIKRGTPDGIDLVANPLSILSFVGGIVKRVITPETEMMHKPAEKLALRTGAMERLNELLSTNFGLRFAYGCSCCALVFQERDADAVLGSEYYKKREQQGRWWDSDVLAATGNLFGPIPIDEVPQEFFDGSVDFGEAEVVSYQRFARIAQACIDEHPRDNVVTLDTWYNRAACFVGGACRKAGDHCPLPPTATELQPAL